MSLKTRCDLGRTRLSFPIEQACHFHRCWFQCRDPGIQIEERPHTAPYPVILQPQCTFTPDGLANLSFAFEVRFDNSNVAGITGGTGAADQAAAAAVMTGIELGIPLAAIGNPSGPIKISAMVNDSNHDFLSNQFLGGLAPPQGNPGGDGGGNFIGDVSGVDLREFAGNQYFFTVPEPGSLSLATLAAVALGLLSRHRVGE